MSERENGDEAADFDETIMAGAANDERGNRGNRGRAPERLDSGLRSDASVEPGPQDDESAEPGPQSDATIVVNDATIAVANDETIAVVDDETIAVVNDATIAVANIEGTIVVPSSRPARRKDFRERESDVAAPAEPVTEAAVPKPRSRSMKRGRGAGVDSGLDPDRPISPAPDLMPWEQQPVVERGVAQGLPVSYGARTRLSPELQTGVDEVHRVLGEAPEWQQVRVRAGREALPSLVRRDRKRTAITLLSYAAAIVISVLGLWGVASIAFG